MRRLGSIWLALTIAPGWACAAAAQSDGDFRIRVYVQPDQEITEQQSLRLVIEAEGPGNPKLSVSGLSKLVNLQVVAGPQQQHQSTWSHRGCRR